MDVGQWTMVNEEWLMDIGLEIGQLTMGEWENGQWIIDIGQQTLDN